MQIFGFSYEAYVLDTQILFPHVFLTNISLSRIDELYKECANNVLGAEINWIILPSNEDEFNLLILDSFRKFLKDIRITAIRCRDRGEQWFYRTTESLIRSQLYPTDFLRYWRSNRAEFSRWLALDNDTIRKREMALLREVLERYRNLTDHATVIIKKWENPEHYKNSCEFCERLKHLKDEGLIPCEAHDEDFSVISDCMVYSNSFLEHGILYLITNDNACYSTVKTIIQFRDEQGHTFHISGFDCKRPTEFLTAIRSLQSSQTS